jgi:hypothetical protein
MLWIHGGGNLNGAGSQPEYDGARLADKGVVVVTINCRLDIFGFLATPELTRWTGWMTSSRNGGKFGACELLRSAGNDVTRPLDPYSGEAVEPSQGATEST